MPPTPSNPNSSVYVLNWEDPDQRLVPDVAPDGWNKEYVVRPPADPAVSAVEISPFLRFIRTLFSPPPVKRIVLLTSDYIPRVSSFLYDANPRDGDWMAKFDLKRDDTEVSNSIRCELAAQGTEPFGAERWYGFSVYLPDSWKPDYKTAPDSVAQWHHSSPDGVPPLGILAREKQWVIAQRDWGAGLTDAITTEIGEYRTGRWTDWVVHVKWSAGPDGLLSIWKNGHPVPGFDESLGEKSGQNTYNLQGNYMKIGIYKWCWKLIEGTPLCSSDPNITQRVIYHDALRIANDMGGSYNAVAPTQVVSLPRRIRDFFWKLPPIPRPRWRAFFCL